jgi:hypothetical protein
MIHVNDLWVYDDSLDEGKALGTAKLNDLALKQDMLFPKDSDPDKLKNERKKGQTVAKRIFDNATKDTRKNFRKLVREYYKGKVNEKALRTNATKIMKGAWKRVFLAGLRAGGTTGGGSGPGKSLVNIDASDEKWVKSAMKHEMGFLNKFLAAMTEDTTKMDPVRRADMYVDALYSFFESARVIALPANTRIWWKGPDDHKTCESCLYLFVNSPYTKLTLPTTPRSGLTLCLTNCRDHLFAKRVSPEVAEADLHGALVERQKHIKVLRKIKRTGHE